MTRRCLFPFTNLTIQVDGSAAPCCKYGVQSNDYNLRRNTLHTHDIEELFNQPAMENIRRRFLNGEEPEGCQACWDEESAGLESLRQIRERHSDNFHWEPGPDRFFDPKIASIDFKLSSLCNLKCRICGPYLSSTWLKEAIDTEEINDSQIKTYSGYSKSKFTILGRNLEIFKKLLPQLRVVEFYGGEPLMQPEHRMMLEVMKNEDLSQHLSINYNTNVTHYDEYFLKVWNGIYRVNLNLSIDDIGPRFEYQRYPAKWSDVLVNAMKYQQNCGKNVFMTQCITVSLYNIFYLDEILAHNERNLRLPITLNMVHFPSKMQIKNLPSKVKDVVRKKLENLDDRITDFIMDRSSISGLISFMMDEPNDPGLINEFIRTTEIHDKYRGQSFSRTFPEYSAMIGSNT